MTSVDNLTCALSRLFTGFTPAEVTEAAARGIGGV
jgi:hypothetical protein